ncbi:aminoglycoside phosphotransferase protein [Penicillium tannophilum]|nr:aminoglycoside phosphotransferase protein [Penicillium tannophilum]
MPPPSALRHDIVQAIRERFDEEQLNPPVPRKFGDIPVSYDAITAEWLTATLNPDSTGTVVKHYTLGPEDNGTANRRRINLEWDGPSAAKFPASVFCKATHAVENRIVLSSGGTHSEISFYNDIRPRVEIEAPSAYFAAYDPQSWASMVMLKDIGDAATFCTHKTVLSKAQFAEQIQILARLHGKFYDSKMPFFKNLVGYKDRFNNLSSFLDIETVCTNGFKAAKEVIPARLFAREAEVWPATVKSVHRNGSLPPTVVHGDVHLGNWYITAEGRMGLTDWQALSRGHWSRDLAYVLGTAVPSDKRRLWENEMVELYVLELEKEGGPKVDPKEAWLELRRQSFGALWYWTMTLTPSTSMPDMQSEETTLDFIGRIAALINDHDALDSFED